MKLQVPPKPWDGMSWYQLADTLRMMPDGHPSTAHKRLAALRENSENEFAEWIERTFAEHLTREAAERWDRQADRLTTWANTLMEK